MEGWRFVQGSAEFGCKLFNKFRRYFFGICERDFSSVPLLAPANASVLVLAFVLNGLIYGTIFLVAGLLMKYSR